MLSLIKSTNGDILGIVLFLMLIVYFLLIDHKTVYENILFLGCTLALAVDIYNVYTVMNKTYLN